MFFLSVPGLFLFAARDVKRQVFIFGVWGQWFIPGRRFIEEIAIPEFIELKVRILPVDVIGYRFEPTEDHTLSQRVQITAQRVMEHYRSFQWIISPLFIVG